MGENQSVRVPKEVLDELESVCRYVRTDAPDIATLRYVAMETGKPVLVVWIDRRPGEYGRGLVDGFEAED